MAAHDGRLNREVAVAFGGGAEEERLQFEARGRRVARARSRYLADVYDCGTYEDLPFVVFERFPKTLYDVIVRDSLSERAAQELGWQMIAALEALHATGSNWADLHPSAIGLTDANEVRLAPWPLTSLEPGVVGQAEAGSVIQEEPLVTYLLQGEQRSITAAIPLIRELAGLDPEGQQESVGAALRVIPIRSGAPASAVEPPHTSADAAPITAAIAAVPASRANGLGRAFDRLGGAVSVAAAVLLLAFIASAALFLGPTAPAQRSGGTHTTAAKHAAHAKVGKATDGGQNAKATEPANAALPNSHPTTRSASTSVPLPPAPAVVTASNSASSQGPSTTATTPSPSSSTTQPLATTTTTTAAPATTTTTAPPPPDPTTTTVPAPTGGTANVQPGGG
jgi:serine/threonine protein kinase